MTAVGAHGTEPGAGWAADPDRHRDTHVPRISERERQERFVGGLCQQSPSLSPTK